MQSLGVPLSGGLDSVSRVAALSNPRLHFSSGYDVCFERAPYRRPGGVDSGQPTQTNCTLFYSLAGVPLPEEPADDKSRRWMKAMTLEPMSLGRPPKPLPEPLASQLTLCPYSHRRQIDLAAKRPPPPPPPQEIGGISDSSASKRAKTHSEAPAQSFFFGDMGVPQQSRGRGQRDGSALMKPPSSDCTSLFVGGLPAEGAEAGGVKEADLAALFPGAISIRCIPNKPFAFVEFRTHEEAAATVRDHLEGRLDLALPASRFPPAGHTLTLGWGKGRHEAAKRPREEVVPASHSDDCWFCLASPVVKVRCAHEALQRRRST
jgi:hypothetical protein